MKLALFNANGISGKLDLIDTFITNEEIDIMFIVETHLRESQAHGRMGNPLFNLAKPDDRDIVGRTRAIGGISAYSREGKYVQFRMIQSDPEANYAIIEVGDLTIGIGYFPPRLEMDAKFESFCERMARLSEERQSIMLGDFNARMGEVAGDHGINTRGRRFVDWLNENEAAQRQEPGVGRYTSYSHGGRGITEHIIAFNTGVTNLKVHERDPLGGSDHRPLTFDWGDAAVPGVEFIRWNIRLLDKEEVREQYALNLTEGEEQLERELQEADNINLKWVKVREWIERAALQSFGKGKFKRGLNTRFLNQELIDLRRRIELEVNEYVDRFEVLTLRRRRAWSERITRLNGEYRSATQQRRKEVFRESMNELGQKQKHAAFMRIIKGGRKRGNRQTCKLEPDMIDEYADHFRTTFGAVPTGEEPPRRLLPDQVIRQQNHFSRERVFNTLKKLALGKAAGFDGIMPEMFVYGGPPMLRVLTELLNNVFEEARIPDEWREAKIVPIFKKKGNELEIKNYRPLAMAAVARRIYEKCLKSEMDETIKKINDFQGGFRKNRSTLDQVFVLNEVGLNHDNMHQLFLDIKAAYDSVNRERLWWKLRVTYNMDEVLLQRLMDLFDNNTSKLVVNGKTSRDIINRRGLLQGSTLSPDLFNVYIDDLITTLINEGPEMATYGTFRSNCLFFADDGNIHASSYEDLRALLRICVEWGDTNGIEFAPSKCVYIGPKDEEELDLEINGVQIPKEEKFTYLGMVMDKKGVNFEDSMNKRIQKAKKTINYMRSVGMNIYGWTTNAAARMYKGFIRSQLEYGLALDILTEQQIQPLEKVQTLAMSRILGVWRTTSRKAMRKLLQLESMKERNHWLNIKFATKLHNSRDGNIPAVKTWRLALGTNGKTVTKNIIRKNMYWGRAKKRDHLFTRLQYDGPDMEKMNPFTLVQREALKLEAFSELTEGVAGPISAEKDGTYQRLLEPNMLSVKQKSTILRWMVGAIARHQECKRCGEELSRQHAIICSGVEDQLVLRNPENSHVNAIDYNISRIAEGEPEIKTRVEEAITTILRVCLNIQVMDSGYWNHEDENEEEIRPRVRHQPRIRVAVLRGNRIANPREALRRHLQALQRNRQRRGPRARRGIG